MIYLPWPGSPIPGNASATGKFRMPNGIYALYHANGEVRFLCRVVSAQVQCWLNLEPDSGHFDEGNSGEAYYKNGTMETFSPWDDSPPFKARIPFQQWREAKIAYLSQPLPPNAPESMELELKDFRASCRLNFNDLEPADWRLRILGFLRRLYFSLPGFTESLDIWRETILQKGRVKPPWDRMLIEELPLCGVARPGLWSPDWSGAFSWKPEPPSWLMQTVAAFQPPLSELGILREVACCVGTPASRPVCRLRGLIFACELLCHLGEADAPAIGLARGLDPGARFEPQRSPWCDFPEELELWELDWQTCPVQLASVGQRRQLTAILQRAGLQPL